VSTHFRDHTEVAVLLVYTDGRLSGWSSLDKLAVRFTAFVLAIVLIGFAAHFAVAGIYATAYNTLDPRKADDKNIHGK
jgi:hypothetical protein